MNDVGRTGMQTEFPTDVQYAILALLADLLGELRTQAGRGPIRLSGRLDEIISLLQDIDQHIRMMQADIEGLCDHLVAVTESRKDDEA